MQKIIKNCNSTTSAVTVIGRNIYFFTDKLQNEKIYPKFN